MCRWKICWRHRSLRRKTRPRSRGAGGTGCRRLKNAADTDYAIADKRVEAAAALKAVKQQLGQRYSPIVNGEVVNTEAMFDSVNPSNPRELIGKVGLADQVHADQALAAAKAAFPAWAATPAQERAAILRRAADIMEARRHELNAWIVYEVGKPLGQADPEVSEAIDFCRFYADEMERLDQGYAYDYPGETKPLPLLPPRHRRGNFPLGNFPMAISHRGWNRGLSLWWRGTAPSLNRRKTPP